jgi:hypothetical protein
MHEKKNLKKNLKLLDAIIVSSIVTHTDTYNIYIHRKQKIELNNILHSQSPGLAQWVLVRSMLPMFLIFRVVCYVLLVFVLCLVPNVTCVSGLLILSFIYLSVTCGRSVFHGYSDFLHQ